MGTEVWSQASRYWRLGRVLEDTGDGPVLVHDYSFIGDPRQVRRRNVRLAR